MNRDDLGEALPQLVDRIVASYLQDQRTQHIDKRHLPSKAATIEIVDTLLELTYPGYIGRMNLTRHNIHYHVGELLPRLWERLTWQIAECLCTEREDHRQDVGDIVQGSGPRPRAAVIRSGRAPVPAGEAHRQDAGATHDRQDAGTTPTDFTEPAAVMARRFIERIPDVRAMLADDVQAAYDGDPAATSTAEVILAYPGVLAISLHRYAHELYLMSVPLMPRIMSEYAHAMTGIDIHPGAQIGRRFFIDHGTAVVIGETTVIGDNCKIYQSVTLGALSIPMDERGRVIRGSKRHPTLGNGVTIYSNATVLGGDTVIGDRSVVGGSVFTARSVEPGHVVSIAPPVLRVRPPRDIAGSAEPALDWVI